MCTLWDMLQEALCFRHCALELSLVAHRPWAPRSQAEAVQRERNMTDGERKERDDALAAVAAAAAEAAATKAAREKADFFYARGHGHKAVKVRAPRQFAARHVCRSTVD